VRRRIQNGCGHPGTVSGHSGPKEIKRARWNPPTWNFHLSGDVPSGALDIIIPAMNPLYKYFLGPR
jgi:hypothetical protein